MTELPRKAVARTARLAALPLGYAGRTAMGMGRRIGGAPAEAVLTEVQQRTAEQLFRTLGELKGGAMKMGQALSILESALPEEVAAPYREQLTRLQDSAPPMSAATVRAVLSAELGRHWRDELVEFDEDPAAAASIGQVHRGRWKDGREVAVKLQYPGAGEALMSDLRQLARVARTFGSLVPGVDVKPLIAEMQERVAEELDYTLEAEAQAQFAAEFEGDPDVLVPHVVTHTSRVLVSEWVESPASLARLIAEGTQEQRDHYGERYIRFLFAGPARVGLLHADPHPGNFRVLPTEDGSLGGLGVVDFGAVARLPERSLPHSIGALLRIASYDDYDDVLTGLRDEGFVKPNIRVDPAELRAYLGPFVEPARTETFRFSREWMRAQFQRIQDPKQPGSTLVLKLNLPPSYLLIHRVWVGSIGVLSQLGAELPFRAILEESLPGFAERA
ncbi:ABC1 kinase family protein [Nocardioides iriomotensis]|uniref:AarF/ABC1/UbiB kinase family protein n=1 Tax=Nocardioides iriomotensis TaxID=715784 RepID=A0A4Q5J6I1_9ACTN|nr:AarF/ABC1/UbiB kinase family protein [Nocardioides iriomotensis]RYU14073.1 AarF/ABC1/UbiB kinase family protein [Nocardioides iriomotensis]